MLYMVIDTILSSVVDVGIVTSYVVINTMWYRVDMMIGSNVDVRMWVCI